jgi:hypothetical protein
MQRGAMIANREVESKQGNKLRGKEYSQLQNGLEQRKKQSGLKNTQYDIKIIACRLS